METLTAFLGIISFSSTIVFLIIALLKKLKKMPTKKTLIIAGILFFIFFICLIIPTCEHSWIDATCTEPKTCELCGKTQGKPNGHSWLDATCLEPNTCSECDLTDGEALGHDWVNATCEEAKTCSRCDETEGEALGHNVKKWKVITDSTCSKQGKKVGVCKRCDLEVTKKIAKKKHTPGEWKIIKKATATEKGERERKCTVCKESLGVEKFSLSKAEYKALCKSYSYNTVARNPDKYEGEYARFYGKVLQVMQESYFGYIAYTLRIGTGGSYYYDNVILATYTVKDDEPRILEGDMITVYGTLKGDYTYETVMGNEMTLPYMSIEYIG